MDVFTAIRSRCSVRAFSPRPIAKKDIESIIDSGRLAPTARKEEPWEFVAVTDKAMLSRIADMADHGKFIKECACAILTLCRETKYYLEDGCAATENMLIAAAGLGIGSCWVAGDKKPYCEGISKLLGAGDGYKLVSIIAFGYPEGAMVPLAKRALASVLHWEKF
jgi:nitroreductase